MKANISKNFKDLKSRITSVKIKHTGIKDNVELEMNMDSRTQVNDVIFSLFLSTVSFVGQIRSMWIYDIKQLMNDPLITTTYICLLSFYFYVFTRFL